MNAAASDATRSILGRGSLYTVATAAPALTGIAVLPVITRVLGVEEYGVVAIVLVVVQIGLILLGLGLGAAVTRTLVLETAGETRATTLVVQGSSVAVALAAALVATGPWWGPPTLGVPWSAALVWATVAAGAGSVVLLAQAKLRGEDRVGRFVALALVANLGGPLLGLLLVVVRPEAAAYAVGLALGQAGAAVTGLLWVARRPARPLELSALRAGLRLGLPTLPHQVSLYLAVGGLVVLAAQVSGPAAGGRANLVLTLGVGGAVLVSAMNNAWAPVVYRAAPADRSAVLDASTRRIGLIAACAGGAVALLGPWLLRVLAPAAYDPGELVAPLALVSAATLVSVGYLASGHLVFASGRTAGLALTTPLSVAGGLAVGAAAMAGLGSVGVGIGYLCTYLFLAAATTWLQRRVSPIPWRPPAVPVAVAVALGATVGGALLPDDGLGGALRLVGAVAVLVGGLVVLVSAVRPRPGRAGAAPLSR